MHARFVKVNRCRLFPRETAAALPLQARLLARMSVGHMEADDLLGLIVASGLPALDDPDAINQTYSNGW